MLFIGRILAISADQVTLVIYVVLAIVLIVANLAERQNAFRGILRFILFVLNLVFVYYFGIAPLIPQAWSYKPPFSLALKPPLGNNGTLLIALGFGIVCTLLLLEPVRRILSPLFPRPDPVTGKRGYNPQSMMQMTALILAFYYVGNNILNYLLLGGFGGLAQDFSAPTVQSQFLELAVLVFFALLGIGLVFRRGLRGALERLGLRAPTPTELVIGVGMAFALIAVQILIANIWTILTPPDTLTQQNQLNSVIINGVGSLFVGFIIALTSGVGEELVFRGELQPVFGIWPTAIFFAMSHIQYLFTPAALIIVFVGAGLGWVRLKYNTTTSMVGHFLYNYIGLALTLFERLPLPK